jgi:hypothetical protein
MKKIMIFITTALLFLTILAACGNSKTTVYSTGSSEPEQDNASGLIKPAASGLCTVSAETCPGIYGSGEVKANDTQLRIEIDQEDLVKIKIDYPIVIRNIQKNIYCKGKITSTTPTVNSDDSDVCYVDAVLFAAQESAEASGTPAPTASVDSSTSSSVTVIKTEEQLPAVDATVEVKISLPKEENSLYIKNECIFTGKDKKKYVWATAKGITETKPEDLKLVEITVGKTDGKVTQVLSGLKAGDTVLMKVI